MPRKNNRQRQSQANEEQKLEQLSSQSSSEDQDAPLLTKKVEYKILSMMAKLKARKKDQQIKEQLENLQQPIFSDNDFSEPQGQKTQNSKKTNGKTEKYTYKQMASENIMIDEDDQSQQELPPVAEQKKAKEKFKEAILKSKENSKTRKQNEQTLFTVKAVKISDKGLRESQLDYTEQEKFNELLRDFPVHNKSDRKNRELVKQVWGNEQNLDQTDLFLKKYILNKKWLSSKLNSNNNQAKQQTEKIDQQDQQRSQQMDIYEAQYNFRYQQPDADKLTYFPRKIDDSLRIKTETRKQKRRTLQQRKKAEQQQHRQQAQKKRIQVKAGIISKLTEQVKAGIQAIDEELNHDWFFCDDCGKGLAQLEIHYVCAECQEYMLCEECFELIIHPHEMNKNKVPKGFGAPPQQVCQKVISSLKNCGKCRKKIVPNKNRYQYVDRNFICHHFCQKCYDQASLQTKKRYKFIQAELDKQNLEQIEEILEKNPQKIKQLTSRQEIEQLVDEYIKNQYEDMLADGTKAKFRYISVKPESYGLSDEQILFGDDKQLNKYVSIKNLATYTQEKMRLRNSIYNQKIKTIKKSVKQNKKDLLKSREWSKTQTQRSTLNKLKRRNATMKFKRLSNQDREGRVRLTNLSNPEKEKKKFIPSNRLLSYGITQ